MLQPNPRLTWNTCHMPSQGENLMHANPAAVSFLYNMVDADSSVSLRPTYVTTACGRDQKEHSADCRAAEHAAAAAAAASSTA